MRFLILILAMTCALSVQAKIKAHAEDNFVSLAGVTAQTTKEEAAEAVLRGIRASYYRMRFDNVTTSKPEFVNVKDLDQLADREDLKGEDQLVESQKQAILDYLDENGGLMFVAQINSEHQPGTGVQAIFVALAESKSDALYIVVNVYSE